MTRYEPGEIVLIAFPQLGTTIRKQRPAVVILDVGDDDLVLAPITSGSRSGAENCRLEAWSSAGLLKPSWARLAKVACLEKRAAARRLGRLEGGDVRAVSECWQRLYSFAPTRGDGG